jgi:hypothetical protein
MRWIVGILLAVVLFAAPATQASPDGRIASQQARAKVAICKTFGKYCQQALSVSWCESKWYVWAQNGQYLGIFQMGSSERAKYGHGSGAWAQARAAERYFVASGRDWSPWSCKPW